MTELELVSTSRLSFDDLIRLTRLILKERPLFFFALATAVIIPSTLLEWWGNKIDAEVISSFLSMAFFGAIAYAVFNEREFNEVSPRQALSQVMSWPLVGLASMWALFNGLALVAVEWADQLSGGSAGMLTAVIALGFYSALSAFFLPAIPVCIVEKLGFEASLRRSLELTGRHRRRIFFIVMGLNCLIILLAILLVLVLTLLPGGEWFLTGTDSPPVTSAQLCVSMAYKAFMMLMEAFSAILFSVVYCDLRDMERTLPV